MKNYSLFTIIWIIIAFAKADLIQAQNDFNAIATYQSKMLLKSPKKSDSTNARQKKMSPEMSAALEKALATAGEAEFTLKFTKDESLYSKVEELAKPKPKTNGITISFSGGGGTYGTTYKDLKEGIFKREDEIMTKEFLIVDDLEEFEWKITGESKMIGNYSAIKAELVPKELSDEEKEKLD